MNLYLKIRNICFIKIFSRRDEQQPQPDPRTFPMTPFYEDEDEAGQPQAPTVTAMPFPFNEKMKSLQQQFPQVEQSQQQFQQPQPQQQFQPLPQQSLQQQPQQQPQQQFQQQQPSQQVPSSDESDSKITGEKLMVRFQIGLKLYWFVSRHY